MFWSMEIDMDDGGRNCVAVTNLPTVFRIAAPVPRPLPLAREICEALFLRFKIYGEVVAPQLVIRILECRFTLEPLYSYGTGRLLSSVEESGPLSALAGKH